MTNAPKPPADWAAIAQLLKHLLTSTALSVDALRGKLTTAEYSLIIGTTADACAPLEANNLAVIRRRLTGMDRDVEIIFQASRRPD